MVRGGGPDVATTVERLAGGLPVIDMINVGHFSLDDASAAMAIGMAIAAETGSWAVLCDMSATTTTPNAAQIVAFVEGMAALELPGFREAVVRPTDVVAATWTSLFVTAARNRHLEVREFRSRAEAIAWLTSDRSADVEAEGYAPA